MNDKENLTIKEEELLNIYYDNECSILQKFFVKKLIKNNELANSYLANLKACSEYIKKETDYSGVSNVASFCSNIKERINSEEHSALFLGERKLVKEKVERASLFTYAPWALSATLLLVLFLNLNFKNLNSLNIDNGLPLASNNNLINSKEFRELRVANTSTSLVDNNLIDSRISNASYGSVSFDNNSSLDEEVFDATPYLEQREQLVKKAVKVDWIRGNGSISLIQQRNTRAPLIWISRNNNNNNNY